jgi:phosphohistidine phosphatase SixA
MQSLRTIGVARKYLKLSTACVWLIACACALIAPLCFVAYTLLSTTTNLIKQRPRVVLMRHGDAPGRSEPGNFDLSDCHTQRNLSNSGRAESAALGNMLRVEKLNVGEVLTSRWCRTQETAHLLSIGPVHLAPAFDNLEYNKYRSDELLAAERHIISGWQGPGTLLIITHSSNIRALSGLDLTSGTMVIAESHDSGEIRYAFASFNLKDLFY